MELPDLIRRIEDELFPQLKLDVWERATYWYLFRQSRLEGRDSIVVGLDSLARAIGMSTFKVRRTLRSMAAKGCIAIEERSRVGHNVRVLLPHEVPKLSSASASTPDLDIESIDFFTDRKFLPALMARQQSRCFYCQRSVTPENAALDHVVAQVNGGGHSYRNVVVACHFCNARKQAEASEVFLRALYRDGVLSAPELSERLEALLALQAGSMKPDVGSGAA